MKKCIYLLFLAIGIISCRQEDSLSEQKNKQEIKTFKLFNKNNYEKYKISNDNSIFGRSYALDFLQAFYSYDLKNNTNYTGLNVKAPIPTSYINFRLHSQIIKNEDGDIQMYFPEIRNKKVINIYLSSINKKNTFLSLYKLNNSVEEYNDIFIAFENAYNSLSGNVNEKILARSETTDVGEVIIKGPQKPTYGVGVVGQCEAFGQCNDGGSGSSSGGSGGSGGGGVPALSPPPPPNISIENMKEFLNCLDINKSANLTVYAEKMGKGHGVGHAFISITQGNNTMTFGFYPKTIFTGMIAGPGVFGNDGGHVYTHSWNVGNITPTQLQQIIATSIAYSNYNYDVAFNNCADFTLTVLNYANVQTTVSGVEHPNTVVEIINNNNGNTGTGNAPQTKRNCK